VQAVTDIITIEDKLTCLKRELDRRRTVYPKGIEDGRISAGRAAHEIGCIQAMIEDYERGGARLKLLERIAAGECADPRGEALKLAGKPQSVEV
jgi:hypothetical protein